MVVMEVWVGKKGGRGGATSGLWCLTWWIRVFGYSSQIAFIKAWITGLEVGSVTCSTSTEVGFLRFSRGGFCFCGS
ncbi:unnamed protein product [Ilex paraguariensis]|uniref:Uncharacterized protein n=1 Tax=Ilex paraguariensis TaxID=185542 RepID=A0ABC8RF22_9AQUA